MNDTIVGFGRTIRKLRNEAGISQERFAAMCDLHRTYISDVELGKRNVSLENIQKMADALNTKISDVFLEVEKVESV
ncbi:MAG: helix-turn-helix transcriptional regulator [Lachnospiraceae bacterium]|nr:helix-turn-helix transcriptional regulator [Lachnospiraceae bacterium]